MRIALEATPTCRPNKSGVPRYGIELMSALVALERDPRELEYTAYFRLSRAYKRGHSRPRLDGVRRRWYQDPLPCPGRRPDLVHGLEVRVPRWRGVRRMATLHDVFSLVSTEFNSEHTRRSRAAAYREMARACDLIVACSECTRRDFLRFHDYPEERVHVVQLGVDERFRPRSAAEIAPVLARHGLDAPYLLFVGDLTVRKNLVRLIRAYRRSAAAADFDLVVIGAPENGLAALHEEIGAAPPGARSIRLLGHVSDAELAPLYCGAAAFLFPTLYEGFGLPVLEAFASGTPVLAADVGAVPEIARGYAELVDPTDEDAIRDGIAAVLARDAEATRRAREHAATFTWERCARSTRALYLGD